MITLPVRMQDLSTLRSALIYASESAEQRAAKYFRFSQQLDIGTDADRAAWSRHMRDALEQMRVCHDALQLP